METLNRISDAKKIRTNYKNVVWFYDFWSWLTESKAITAVFELAEIKDNQKILEIACGTGVVFEKIVRKNPNGQNTGFDFSPDMLAKARKRLAKLRSHNCELLEGDVLNMGFPDNTFDLVINNFMIDLMPEKTFDEIAAAFFRILKPGGLVVISTFSFGNNKSSMFWYWIAKTMPDLLAGCRPVSIGKNLQKAGFIIEKDFHITQNTFPSEVIKARKPK